MEDVLDFSRMSEHIFDHNYFLVISFEISFVLAIKIDLIINTART